ncbi:MAG: hypothetical protein ACJ754_03265 [Pyrinomonadaceae bacterium]
MSKPKELLEKLDRIVNAWRTLSPNKTFGGMTLMQFEEECLPSREARNAIEELQDRQTKALTGRDTADANTASKIQLVVAGVLGDPTEGPDSPLVDAFGYTRKSERKTGLTRKHKETGASVK